MKNYLLVLFLLISITSYAQTPEWIPFTWASGRISGRSMDKLAIKIPVTIDELPHTFEMQLDLGAVETMFYEKSLNAYLSKHPSLRNKLDTTKIAWINSQPNPIFQHVDLKLGKVDFKDRDVALYKNFGRENSEIIGTIAPDLLQNRILIIDYTSNRMAVTDNLPKEYQDASFEKFEIKKGRIRIPFQINGKTEYLMFDTGSSMFALSTSRKNASEIGGDKIIDSLIVPSWGKKLTIYGLNTVVPIMFGNKKLENSVVYYDNDENSDYFYESEKIWGITGNAYFFNNIIIIDYKNNRFGVK